MSAFARSPASASSAAPPPSPLTLPPRASPSAALAPTAPPAPWSSGTAFPSTTPSAVGSTGTASPPKNSIALKSFRRLPPASSATGTWPASSALLLANPNRPSSRHPTSAATTTHTTSPPEPSAVGLIGRRRPSFMPSPPMAGILRPSPTAAPSTGAPPSTSSPAPPGLTTSLRTTAPFFASMSWPRTAPTAPPCRTIPPASELSPATT